VAEPKVAIQGGGPNYLGKQPTVSGIPRKWKSSPDHPTAQLAYITDKEKDILIDLDLYGSLNGKPNRGPGGVISLQGDMGGYGGTGGQGGFNTGGGNQGGDNRGTHHYASGAVGTSTTSTPSTDAEAATARQEHERNVQRAINQSWGPGVDQDSPGQGSYSLGVEGDPDKAKLSKDLVEKLAPDTLKALIAGGHGVSGSTYGGLSDDAKDRVDDAVFGLGEDEAEAALDAHQRVMAYVTQQAIPVPPHIDRLTPQVAAALTMNQLSPQQQSAFISKYGSLENMGYVPGQGLMNLTQQPTVRDITTGEILGYPSEGLTGYLGMAADFLGLDTSGVNFGVDPEAEREATRGRELTPADPLYYQTLADEATGMPQTVSLEEDITGVMDYAPVYYGVDNWPGAISYAKNGGLASLVPKRRKV
tara:strand:+ start:34 stop:1287 length:1254 start_codon:yes stop_codon:yes gene_type:complete